MWLKLIDVSVCYLYSLKYINLHLVSSHLLFFFWENMYENRFVIIKTIFFNRIENSFLNSSCHPSIQLELYTSFFQVFFCIFQDLDAFSSPYGFIKLASHRCKGSKGRSSLLSWAPLSLLIFAVSYLSSRQSVWFSSQQRVMNYEPIKKLIHYYTLCGCY